MSTEIFYRKAFIKVDNNRVIPVYEGGSSNCTMFNHNGREVLERDWRNDSYYSKGGIIIENEALLRGVDVDGQREVERNHKSGYNEKDFAWYFGLRIYGQQGCSFKQFKSYFSNGIKTSKTIEEYLLWGVKFSIKPYVYDEELTAKLSFIKPKVVFESTSHMIDTIAEYLEYYKDTKVNCYVTLEDVCNYEHILKQHRVKRVQSVKKELNQFYTIVVVENGCYFARFTKNGFKYSYHTIYKKFETMKQAIYYHSKMRSSSRFAVKFIDYSL